MAKLLITFSIIALLIVPTHAIEQTDSLKDQQKLLFVGYYAPYALQSGMRMGMNFHFKTLVQNTKSKDQRFHKLDITPRFAYFSQAEVQRNYFTDVTFEYQSYKRKKKTQPKF